jgi:hypothetical protein
VPTFDPSDCPLGYGYFYADGVDLTGWANPNATDALPAIESNLGVYRHRITLVGGDIGSQKILTRTLPATPISFEMDLGISLSAYHYSNGLDSASFFELAGLYGYDLSSNVKFAVRFLYRSRRPTGDAKKYTVTLQIVGATSGLNSSSTILDHELTAGEIPYNYEASFRVKVLQTALNTIEYYIDGALIATMTHADFNMSAKVGLVFEQVSYSPDNTLQKDYGWIDNFRAVGDLTMGTACGPTAVGVGLAHGFDGFVSVFEDDWVGGTTHSYPQPLYLDQDSLTFGKEIVVLGQAVGDGRVTNSDSVVYKAAKPEGGLTFQFRSSDILKTLYSHFQLGSVESGTSPYRYSFYPKKDPLDWSTRGTSPRGTYGETPGQPYTVSVLKKVLSPANAYGGTNSFFFKHAICDKLGFNLSVGDDAKAQANFKFRDLDYGTAVSANPDSVEVGTYAKTPSFISWGASISLGGTAYDLSAFRLNSDQSSQEFSRLGRQAPENFNYDSYKITGEAMFDLPLDAMKEIGSMFTGQTFAFVATLYNGTADRVVFNLPTCRRMPFDFSPKSGAESLGVSMPFEAFESAGTYPIKVTVDTTYSFNGLLGTGA